MNQARDHYNVVLHRTEIDQLVRNHRDREDECAGSSNYLQANVHKNRANELLKIAYGLIRREVAAE